MAISEERIPFIIEGQKIANSQGQTQPWFVEAWAHLVRRVGGEYTNYVAIDPNQKLQAYVDNSLSAAELRQLQNIDALAIGSTQWTALSNVTGNFGTAAYVADDTLVHRAGDETISGNKTFSFAPTAPGYKVSGTQVLTTQQAAITSLTDSTGVTHDDTIADIGTISDLTENSSSVGGTNDGDLPDLSATPSGTDAALITALVAAVRELAERSNTHNTALSTLESNDSDLSAKTEEILALARTHGLIAT